MPLPAQQPREPLFTTCVKRGRNRSFYFKNLFLDAIPGAREAGFPRVSTTRPAFGLGSGLAVDYWCPWVLKQALKGSWFLNC